MVPAKSSEISEGSESGRITFVVMALLVGDHDGFDGHCADLVPVHRDCTFIIRYHCSTNLHRPTRRFQCCLDAREHTDGPLMVAD